MRLQHMGAATTPNLTCAKIGGSLQSPHNPSLPQAKGGARQASTSFTSLPPVKGGGFCAAKLGGIVINMLPIF